ncbi:hypothetical protein [Phoenicibacter congonensis]|nr:hypothetical protein [Phoenicibacter congonensis]
MPAFAGCDDVLVIILELLVGFYGEPSMRLADEILAFVPIFAIISWL